MTKILCKSDNSTFSIHMDGVREDMSRLLPGILLAVGNAEMSGVKFDLTLEEKTHTQTGGMVEDKAQAEPITWQREMALYEGAVERFGIVPQIMQTIEEMAELIQALNKYIRHVEHGQGNLSEVLDKVNEERADVSIMLNQLDVIFDDNSEKELEKLAHLALLLNKKESR